MKRKHPESDLQIACVKWARHQYPILQKLLFSIPNGGNRVKKQNKSGGWYSPEMGIMKAEGLTEGVFDLFCAVPTDEHPGLFIEMKSKTGTMSDAQKEFRQFAELAGYRCEVCKTFEAFEAVLKDHLQKSKFRKVNL